MQNLTEIPIPAPPFLLEVLDCKINYQIRWVCFYFDPSGQLGLFDDGNVCGHMFLPAFLLLLNHKKIAAYVGFSDLQETAEEIGKRMVLDQENGKLFVGSITDVAGLLSNQWKEKLEIDPSVEINAQINREELDATVMELFNKYKGANSMAREKDMLLFKLEIWLNRY
jgi:hypothetical protein